MVLVLLIPFGSQVLTLVGASGEIMGPALAYLQIRALAAPAVLVMFVLNGFCLAQQEVRPSGPVPLLACGSDAFPSSSAHRRP